MSAKSRRIPTQHQTPNTPIISRLTPPAEPSKAKTSVICAISRPHSKKSSRFQSITKAAWQKYPICEIPRGTEILYIGSRTDCRECLVLFGELAKNPDHVRAVMVDKTGNEIANWTFARDEKREARNESEQSQYDHNYELEGRDRVYRTSSSESDLPLGGISKFIAEPAPVLLRSHLFGVVALAHDETTHLISPGIAYVTSEKPLPAPAFANYEILESSEISTGAVRAMLKSHDIGKLTLKLRGVKVDPDQEIKRLKPKGKNSATLFYTRLDGEKIAILANPVKEMPASAGMTSGGAAPKNL